MPRKPEFIMPTDDEDARINQGIAMDPDSPELTEADFLRAQPAQEVVPALANARRVRGPQKAPTKTLVSMRLDPDLVARLKADGPGWQGRANELLRQAVGL
ncbi:MAG: BrnA antitoxin family protein [Acetobacter okinawensis]|uniref:BrnA antitoxin family protein n=1 Tax=Acetobacter okinawensis TaxID=1076594 RepID=UPI0039E7F908